MNLSQSRTCQECGAPLPQIEVTRCEPCLERLLGPLSTRELVQERERVQARIAETSARRDALQALWEWREDHPDTE